MSVHFVELSDEAQQAEALQVLGAIFDVRERQSDERPENVAKITHTLAMLHYILHNIDKVSKDTGAATTRISVSCLYARVSDTSVLGNLTTDCDT